MSDSKFVVFNCSRGPIILTFYNQSSFENLSTMTSHHRRRAAKTVFKNVTLRNNCSMDLVAETGLPISELEKNQDLANFIRLNKVRLILNSEKVIEESVSIPQEIPQETTQEIPKDVKSEVFLDMVLDMIVEEVVDPEELRRAILEDSMAIEESLLEEGNIFSSNSKELAQKEEKKEDKPTQKKKSGRPKKGHK